MNYHQIAFLFLQGTLVAFVILFLFRLRKRLGIGVLFACLGLFQFMQVFLSSTVYISITDNFIVSPGSTVLFTATLFALLIIYIKEDASETKKIIYALFFTNIIISVFLQVFGWSLKDVTHNPYNVSTKLFDTNAWVLFVGTIVLFIDSLFIILIFEFISKKIRFLFLQICLTMLIVVFFDTVCFSVLAFWSSENLNSILTSGLIAKGVFTIFYSILFYFYLIHFDSKSNLKNFFNLKDVFKPLTYKQKFESVTNEIKKAEEMYRLLANHSNDIICLQEKDNTFKYISPSFKKVLGYEMSDFIGKTIFDIVHKEDLQDLKNAIEKKVFKNNFKNNSYLCRFLHKDGHFVWIEFLSSPVYKNQKISYFVTSGRDITQRVLAKKKIQDAIKLLEEKEQSLKEASKLAKIGYWEYNIKSDTLIWSEYVHHIFGSNPKENPPEQKDLIEKFEKESQKKLFKANEELTYKGTPYDIELKLVNLKDETVWIRNLVEPIYNEQNEIIGRKGVLQDITDFKKTQLELENSKQKIQESLELLKIKEADLHEVSGIAKIGYWEYSIDNVNVIWSDYHYEIFGLNPKDGIPSREKLLSYFDKESQEKIEKANLKLHTEGVAFDIEVKLINQKNKEVWVRNVVQPVYDKQNKIIGRRGLLQDITESKKAKEKIETALALIEKRDYSMLQASEMAKIGFWEYYLETDEFTWSDYVYKLCGLDLKDKIPLQREIIKICDEKSLNKLKKATENLNLNGTPYDLELKLTNFKNVEVWVRTVAQPIYNQQNKVVGRKGVIQDITDFKKAQIELELSKQKIQESLDLLEKRKYSMDEAGKLAKIGYWDVNTENNTSIWSDYVHYAIGSNPGDGIPDESIVKKHLSKESYELFTKSTQEISLKGIPYDIEVNFKNLKNEKVWIRIIAQPVYNQENKIIGRRGLLQNITASKKAKEKIQESLELLEKRKYSMDEASKVAKIGYFEHNIITDNFIWSDYLFQIYGFDFKKGIPPEKEFIEILDKKYREILKKATLNLNTKGVPYDIEIKLFNKIKNKHIWVRSVAQPIYNEKNEIIGRRGVTQDITNSKNAQQELENSKQKIQESLELLEKRKYSMDEASKVAKIGYWEHNIKNESIVWSDYMHEIFGSNLEKGIPDQKIIINNFDNESQEIFDRATKNLLFNGQSYDIILKYNNPIKGEIWVRNVAQPIYNKQNKIIGKRGILQDITKEKNTEIKLKDNEEKFFTIFNSSPNLIILTSLKDLKITDVNERALNATGYTALELTNQTISPTDIWKSSDKRKKYFKKLKEKGQIKNFETEFITKSGETRIWKSSSQIIKISNEEYALNIIEDITEIKAAQFEIQKQTEFINAMTENLPNAIIACNSEGELVLFNKKAIEWHGIDVMNISREQWAENYGLYKQDGESLLKTEEVPLIQVFNGKKISNIEIVIKAKNQKPRRVICNGASFYDSDGNILGALIVMNDITKQKLIENNLKRSEFETRKALKEIERSEFLLKESGRLAKVGGWELKLPSQEIRWSNQVFTIHGLPVGKPPSLEDCINYYIDGSAEILTKAIEKSISEKEKFNLVLRFQNEKKEKLWVKATGYPLTNKEGEVTSLIGVFQDITESKNKQDKLDTQNEELHSLNKALNEAQELSHLGSWKYISATGDVTWSKELFNIFERSYELGAPNYSEHKMLYTEESFTIMNQAVSDCIEKQIPYNLDLDIYTTKGNLKHIRSRGKALKDRDNKVIGCYGTAQDITEQKIKQKNLDAQNEKLFKLNNALNEAQEISKLGSWEYIYETDIVTWSKELYNILGFSEEMSSSKLSDHKPLYTEESFARVNEAVANCINHQTPYNIELDVYSSDGSLKHIVSRGRVLKDKDNNIIGCYGTAQDVTEEKKIRNEIKKAEEMYRLLTDNSNDLICLHKTDSTFKYISPSIKNILGYEQSELIETLGFNIIHKKEVDFFRESITKRVFKEVPNDTFFCRTLHKEGHYLWLEYSVSVVYLEDKINYILTSARDITQWILAKQEIQEYQKSLQKLTTEITLVEEKQKKEIASNIHDHLSQSLVISNMKIKELKKKPLFKEIDEELNFIYEHVSDALSNSRKITSELSPPILYKLGIIEALYWLLENIETKHKIKCVLNEDINEVKLDEIKSILVYRSIQELINNTIKYAKATLITIDIDLNSKKNGVNIILKDNGVGFDTSNLNNFHKDKGSGFGLFTVKERIKNIKGRFKITSEKNKGTLINIFIPLDK